MNIRDELFKLKDEKNARFMRKLIPNITEKTVLGIRVPELRKLAKSIANTPEAELFLKELPHYYFDENMLHALIINESRSIEVCFREVELFLPYIDNWAVCDGLSPKVFKKEKQLLIDKIGEWINSSHTYICRFAIEMLMKHFLDDDFDKRYSDMVASIHSHEYYVNMMIAWYFATALAKQWDCAVAYLQTNALDTFVHNKTIQKARESYKITKEQKLLLAELKRI